MSLRGRIRSRRDKVFGSYSEALAACGTTYDDDVLARVVVEKTRRVRQALAAGQYPLDIGSIRTLAGVGFVLSDSHRPIRVLDFGGAAGFHYLVTRSTQPPDVLFDWRVVETPALARAAAELEDGQVSFYSSIEDAVATWDSPPDLTFASGVLQCVPDPIHFTRMLVDVSAPVLFITRTNFSTDETTRSIIQYSTLGINGPGPLPPGFTDAELAFPATFVPTSEIEKVLASRYAIVARLAEDPCAYTVNGRCIPMVGYVCRLEAR